MKILNLVQGSDAWKKARYGYITATDVSTILDINPYETALELFERKYQRLEKIFDPFTQRRLDLGHQFEAEMSEFLNIDSKPVITHEKYPHLLASLDGYKDDIVYEFKYSEKKVSEIPPEHKIQVQTQLLLTGASFAFYIRGTSKDDFQKEAILADDLQHQTIIEESLKFMNRLQQGKAPEPTARDLLVIDDKVLEEIGMAMKLKQIYEDVIEQGKLYLSQKYSHPRITNGKVVMTKSIRKGSIPYSKLEEIKALDLEQYRTKDIEVITLRLKK